MSLKQGTQFRAMVIHSSTLLVSCALSQAFMSTSMEREYRVWLPSSPPSPSQPGRSLLASPKAKRCDPPPLRRSNTPFASVSQPRAASRRHGPPPLRPRVVHLYRRNGRHVRGLHPGQGVHAHEVDRLHAQYQTPRPKRARAPKTTAHSRQNAKERNTIVRPICPSMALEGHSRHLDGFRP